MDMKKKIKKNILDVFFPKFCFGCQREGEYLCQDCESILEISDLHQPLRGKYIDDLYFPLEYKNPLIKKLIKKFKYEPFIKDLSSCLSSLIVNHLKLLNNPPDFLHSRRDFVMVPVPLHKKRMKWRGFNQAEEITNHLSKSLKINLINDVLLKKKSTPPQVKIPEEQRKKNTRGIFVCREKEKIQGKNVLLVDDVYTTGSTLNEAAQALKKNGVNKIIGLVVARASPGQDRL